ncbi:uncharacterized protein [Amphiura filiformis]|uniref:uncharacterized protein n=1 Tax=Amphiura filiformis TaxID=82378 RepID=UPI003B20DCCD
MLMFSDLVGVFGDDRLSSMEKGVDHAEFLNERVIGTKLKVLVCVCLFSINRHNGEAAQQGNSDTAGSGPEGPAGPAGSTDPEVPRSLAGPPVPAADLSGTIYIRWGRDDCPSTASKVYDGVAGGAWFDFTGSGSNYLCLPWDPVYLPYQSGKQDYRGMVYNAEYETSDFPPLSNVHNYDVPCVVCEVNSRLKMLMIPGTESCPAGWIEEYDGYLMSDMFSRDSPTEFVCVDQYPDVIPGTSADENGVVFYPVESRCFSNLPCPKYVDGGELACVVCTK